MAFKRLTKEEAERLHIGDEITVNARYEDLTDINGNHFPYVIKKDDRLFIREVRDNGFVVELIEDVLAKEKNRDFLYGLFFVEFHKIQGLELATV